MKPTKSICNKGITIELLTINGKFYVRKRSGNKVISMSNFATLEAASQFFSFVR